MYMLVTMLWSKENVGGKNGRDTISVTKTCLMLRRLKALIEEAKNTEGTDHGNRRLELRVVCDNVRLAGASL